MKKLKSCRIVIEITEKEFYEYNPKIPIDRMRLIVYAQKVETFIRQAIDSENHLMCGSIYIESC